MSSVNDGLSNSFDSNISDVCFYIYAPAFRENSAGIGVLYRLCDGLNHFGYKSFMVVHNPNESSDPHQFNSPVLTFEIAKKHFLTGSKIVVVYSETVVGNPLRAKNVVRYLLNYPGTLGGTIRFADTEYILSYSKNISQEYGGAGDVLFIPAVDPDKLPSSVAKERLSLVYAGKYRAFVGEPKGQYIEPFIEIFRDGERRQARNEVLDLLSRASQIYVWENSSIATEAILLGTPVIFIQNKFLNKVIAEFELGPFGYTFGSSESEIEMARNQIPLAIKRYYEVWGSYLKEISNFAEKIEGMYGHLKRDSKPIKPPRGDVFFSVHRIKMFFAICHNMGLLKALKVANEFGYMRLKDLSRRKGLK